MIMQQNAKFIIQGNLTLNSGTIALPNTIDKSDTVTVMGYNVLSYGDGCQGSTNTLNSYLKTIVQYAHPDILSCEKMDGFYVNSTGEANYAMQIRDSVLNVLYPNQFDFGTPTNVAANSKMSCLFYNKQKFTYVKTEVLVSNISDFDMYKLYYNDANLSITNDTTFLYVIVNHTQSGSNSTSRDQQVSAYMDTLRTKFAYFPNVINMGDFNTNNSSEAGYQSIISNADSLTMMSDPSFYPDMVNHYPADWSSYPVTFAGYLTTTTRQTSSSPNNCGTSGGAKSWFEHIFISPWIVSGTNFIKYIPGSYQTIGNDGYRNSVSVNSTSPVTNTSAPAAVLNAEFQFSDKYPVMIKLVIKANKTAVSPIDPVERD
jgi:endonuclease/exonuclease/phosphatase family metal-dependent hydrolase